MTVYDSRRYAMINRWDSAHLDTVDRLLTVSSGDRVIEIGCGQGHLTKRLAARGVDIVGIDANPAAPEVAGSGLVRHMTAEKLEFDDCSFDYVLSFHAIEHIPGLETALAEMARVLRPGGKALLVYPAEPIMGVYAIPTSVILHGTPWRAREIHCQKLWPAKLRRLVQPLGLVEVDKEFHLFKTPQFVSVFEKAS
jgi:ubiquinone/menaquinone biosynthesis C-methylase UbiE